MRRKQFRSIVVISLILSLLLAELLPLHAYTVSQAASYGLSNPTIDSDGVTTWDCVYFGNYWQNDTNGDGTADKNDKKEPIKWRVLSVDSDDAFLLADQNLDCQSYNDTHRSVTWETCTMRSWLNGYGSSSNVCEKDYTSNNFIDNAFSTFEQIAIKNTTVVNVDNAEYGILGGNDTADRVYLLSFDETKNLEFGYNSLAYVKSREVKSTNYAKAQGAWGQYHYDDNAVWWLRTSNQEHTTAFTVLWDGSLNLYNVDTYGFGVRPALHLNLSNTNVWSYAGTVTSEGGEAEDVTPTPNPTVPSTPVPTKVPVSQTPSPDNTLGFQLGWDNNRYLHQYNYVTSSGFYGVKNYKISEVLFEKLAKYATKGEISDMKKFMRQKWAGSCYGIAATMGLVFEGYLDINDINSNGADCYYNLPLPKDDEKLINAINYYHISTLLRMNKVKAFRIASSQNGLCGSKLYSDSLEVCLQRIVEEALSGHVYMFAFVPQGKGGHCILVTGCKYDSKKDCYVVTLYDENSLSFSKMQVSGDYRTFSFPYEKEEVNEKNYLTLDFFDLSKMSLILDHISHSMMAYRLNDENTNTCTIKFDVGKPVCITNEEGEKLEYDGDAISGNMNVYDAYISIYDEENQIHVETDNSVAFQISDIDNECNVDITNEDSFKSVSAVGLESASIEMNGSMELYGNAVDFKVFTSTNAEVGMNESALVSAEGQGEKQVTINSSGDDVSISSENGITNLITCTYEGVEQEETSHDGKQSVVTVITQNKVAEETPTLEPPTTNTPAPNTSTSPFATNISAPTRRPPVIVRSTPKPYTPPKIKVKAPGKVKLKKAKALGKRKVKVSWKRSSVYDGYQLQYAMNRSFTKKRRTQYEYSVTSDITLKNLKKGKTYYFRIRAYNRGLSGEIKYGKWSNVKKCRVK